LLVGLRERGHRARRLRCNRTGLVAQRRFFFKRASARSIVR
jgi:hypothetical protein